MTYEEALKYIHSVNWVGSKLGLERTRELLEKGCENLFHHVETIKKSGIVPVVCINQFYTDTEAEIALLRKLCAEKGVRCALSNHWRLGGEGAIELAETVVDACNESNEIKFLYPLEMPLRERVEKIAKEVYGADGVDWAPLALEKAKRFESDPKYADYCTMMVKTHLSLSHEPSWKGVPKGWRLPFSAKTLMASRDSQHSSMIFTGTWQATMVASSRTLSRLGSSLGMP